MKIIDKEDSHTEIYWWGSWKEMLFGLELRTQAAPYGRIWTFGLTILYRVIFFIEYTKFNEKSQIARKLRLTQEL
jgi:hypothetical protein